MKDIRTLHKEAIVLIKQANNALQEGSDDLFLLLGKEAFSLEKEAALMLINEFDAEPTRSVLFRSAATLAFNIGNYQDAEKLIYLALSGNLFFELKQELLQLLDKTQYAIAINAGKAAGLQNAYLDNLKEKAIYIKLEPKEKNRFSKAIVVDYMIDFLKNIQNCFLGFSEVNFKRTFNKDDFRDFSKVLGLFKKESKTLCVDLKFASFGVSIVADTSVMNYQDIASTDKFRNFKTDLFKDFKQEVLLADYNSAAFQEEVQKKYSPEERIQIFSPIVDTLKEKSNYRISVVDKDFKNVIKACPVITKQTQSILKPVVIEPELTDEEVLLRRTFELTTSEGQKKEKLFSENLDYAEFKIILENVTSGNKQAFLVSPYELKIIFNHGIFVIDDEYYKIYVEHKDYKEAQKNYTKELLEKFELLLERNERTLDETNLLDLMKSTILKVW